jgi:hypothetical protein
MELYENISGFISKYEKISKLESKLFGEVFTPTKLINDMLDKLPNSVWKNPNLKWLDPAVGIGNFPSPILDRLMIGLSDVIPNDNERKKHIIENMLYFCDISTKNLFLLYMLFDKNNEFKLNVYRGSFLTTDFDQHTKEIWGLNGFDIIVGNPPYNDIPKSDIKKTSGAIIWDKFVEKSLNILNSDGYLVFVHPAIWRKPIDGKSKILNILDIFKKYNLMYLEIHNVSDGIKTFGAGTRYDFYCFQKSNIYKTTEIKDENGITNFVDITKLNFIPNYNIDKIVDITSGNNKINVIYDSAYHASREYISITKNEIYKYPVIHSTPKKGARILYSNINNKGHFGIPKVIFGESGINNVIIDKNGEFGMTQGAIGIILEEDDNPEKLKKVLESEKFQNIISSCIWSNFRIDAKLFRYFNKKWYEKL